jgi:hypothetical protein
MNEFQVNHFQLYHVEKTLPVLFDEMMMSALYIY